MSLTKRHVFVIGVMLVLLTSACQSFKKEAEKPKLTSINIIDRNGMSETTSNADRLNKFENVDFLSNQPYQKVLRIFSRDARGDICAYITSYHPNGQPKQYLEVVNNRAYGFYREWHSNGVMKLEVFVIGGMADINTAAEQSWLFEGSSKAWDENGNLIADLPYSKGELEGFSTYYHPNGSIWKVISFHHGKMEGTSEVFLESGAPFQTTEFLHGEKNGASKRFWENGSIAADETYCQGRLITGRYYNLCGGLVGSVDHGAGHRVLFSKDAISEIDEIHDGIVSGEIKVYNEFGSLARLYHVKDGLKHGTEIEYYTLKDSKGVLVPKLSMNWVAGKVQGLCKTWYPNGIQESQREMNNNEKNGLLTAWYNDGSMMLIEEYEKDKLTKGEYYIRGEKTPISEVKNGKGLATIFDAEGNLVRKVTYAGNKPSF